MTGYVDIRACECCGRENGQVHVRCSGIGPMSMAYCHECLVVGAEPAWSLQYLWDFVADRKQGALNPAAVDGMKTWDGEKYITWEQWIENELANPRPEVDWETVMGPDDAVDFTDLSDLGFDVIEPEEPK